MFQPDSNLQKLVLNCHGISFSRPITALLQTILAPESHLDHLGLVGIGNNGGAIAIISTVMQALEKNSKLWILEFDFIGVTACH